MARSTTTKTVLKTTALPGEAEAAGAAGPKGKLGTVADLLSRPEGASIAEMAQATGWQAHSIRGALSGGLKRKHGLAVLSEKTDTGRVYRIAADPA